MRGHYQSDLRFAAALRYRKSFHFPSGMASDGVVTPSGIRILLSDHLSLCLVQRSLNFLLNTLAF